jgi:predicted RND superfamily exporter protein
MGVFEARTDTGAGKSSGGKSPRLHDRERADERLFIAFGAERLGFLGLRAPLATIAALLVLFVLAVFGIYRLTVDDSLSELFRAETPEFKLFEAEAKKFPSNEYDVLVVVEGKNLLGRAQIEGLRRAVTDLQLVDGDDGLISLFSARQPSPQGGLPAPVFPEQLPEGAAYDSLVERLKDNDLIRGKLLSEDGTLTLVVMSLDPAVTHGGKLAPVVADIRKTLAEDLDGTGLSYQLSGVPIMQLQIRQAVERDRIDYNVVGFALGCLVAILFFRRASFLIIATAPPLLAVVLALGAVGWLDLRLNMFLNVMSPLIMVISFSDSMQLTFAARDRLIRGDSRLEAFRSALYTVGPACVLTHATAALSFFALRFSDSDMIRAFGLAGLVAMGIALVTVLTLVPALGMLIAPAGAKARRLGAADRGVDALRAFCDGVADRMTRRPGLASLTGLAVVAVLSLAYFGLQPRYRLADQAPDREHAIDAINRIDAKLAGANPVDVMITFPPGKGLLSPESLDVLAETHAIVESQAGLGNVWSLQTLRNWLKDKLGRTDVATLQSYIDVLPKFLTRRFYSADGTAELVAGRIPDRDASELLPVVDKLDRALDAVRADHPGYGVAVTGLAVIAARNSAGMIDKLGRGLTLEFAGVAIFIGLAFRSLAVTLVTIPTGIFPVVAAGALLWALGSGMQFASVIALTVSFGLGLSATIHFLNRLWREVGADPDPAVGVRRATVLVGPALILTSVVLVFGLAATAFSNLPMLRTFGWLSAFAMFAALVADLTILRPMMTVLLRWEARIMRARPDQRFSSQQRRT